MVLPNPKRFVQEVACSPVRQVSPPAPHAQAKHFAGRLAAKEAVVKALGTGFSQGIAWSEVEIGRADSGAPAVVLSGRALEVAVELGVTRWHLSISDSPTYAAASAIAVDD